MDESEPNFILEERLLSGSAPRRRIFAKSGE
jgi:hypothetical protein